MSKALAAALAPAPQAWTDVEEAAARGVRARDAQGVEWRLGSAAWAGREGEGGEFQVWLSRAGVPVAAFAFDEALRPGAAEALAALRADGVQIALLSGDAPQRAARLAGTLGITQVAGGVTPEAKLAAIADAQQAGEAVGMVGDGVNDGPVLARADVSIAMGQGALVARAQADAVIVSNRPLDIVHARQTAQRALRIVRQNLAWAAVYNALCIPLALVGWLPPWAAGLGMAASSLAVVLNALRAGR